jgi:hypothetical protein
MVTAETQRTLVKSPPELWGELSDQSALRRHLAGLGEIRIVASKPEQSVEWEAEAARGKVEIKPSGWGTKVTLSATVDGSSSTLGGAEPASGSMAHGEPDAGSQAPRDADFQVPPAAESQAEPNAESQAPPDAESQAEPNAESQVEPDAESQAEPNAESQVEPDAEADEPHGSPSSDRAPSRLFSRLRWRGWFARRRRGGADTPRLEPLSQPEGPVAVTETDTAGSLEPETAGSLEPDAAGSLEPETAGSLKPESASPLNTERDSAPESEIASAEERALERTTELLRAALDSLGEAHHRPFSRA